MDLRDFLRRCPSCGRRFVVKIRSKRVIDAGRETERIVHDIVVGGLGAPNPSESPSR